MSEKYSSEFKAKVAIEAVAQGRSVIEKIATKHGISEDDVIEWAAQLHDEASQIFTTDTVQADEIVTEEVEITTEDEEFALAVGHGVMDDKLNYNRLIFWSALGAGLIVIFVIGMVYFSQYSLFESQKQVSTQTTYSEIKELKAKQNQELNSFGVVDLEEGIYRIPIDSAISRIATD